jgi:diaminohydroxyphosphoribosylaminopyrimidine deaminase/5-amino-6-(5-phosphoribosylamino)uracil reductase
VEGGAVLAASLFASRLIDRWTLFIAPLVAGGDNCHGLLSGAGAETVEEMQKAGQMKFRRSGPDLRIDAHFG